MAQLTQNNIIIDFYWINRKFLSWCILLSSAFLFCFAEAIISLIVAWNNSYIYSYGFLVPLISLYIVWERREKIRNIQPMPSCLSGFLVLSAGLAFLIIGAVYGKTSVKGFSLITAITSIILFIFGRQFLKSVWFSVTYLILMVPFWDNFTERLHLPFQNFSAMTGTMLLRLTGIPVYRESVYISLPNITLEVAKVCSGVNQLIAVAAIAIPLAYLTLGNWLKRIVLICSGIVIAMTGNSLRIAVIGILSYYGISDVLHGPYHVLQAMSVSLLGFIALFIGAWILSDRKICTDISLQVDKTTISKNCLSSTYTYCSEIRYPFLSAIIILLIVGTYLNFYR